jgi:hypothetical protein
MHDQIILNVAELMTEQTDAYARLESAGNQLASAMVRGEPAAIESLTKIGETELLRMRVCLLKITSALTMFAESRTGEAEKSPLDQEGREKFEAAAKRLLESARSFQNVSSRAANLAIGGTSFSSACVQMCGVPPTTYRQPVLKYTEGERR